MVDPTTNTFPVLPEELRKKHQAKQLLVRRQRFEDRRRKRLETRFAKGSDHIISKTPVLISKKRRMRDPIQLVHRKRVQWSMKYFMLYLKLMMLYSYLLNQMQ
ncbi:unnamed protein product [Rhizopus microsporus]